MKKNRLIWAAVAAVLILFCIFAIIVERKNQDALQSVSASGVSGHPTILIDAGHGGVDGGTVAKDGTVEKGINLEIALKLETIFRMMGFDTVMTRREDISIHDDSAKTIRQKKISDLHNRLKLINETPDCLFISIHQNSYPYPNPAHTPLIYAIICGVGALVSMVGDLAASAIKRQENIKDYGTLIPGHGGILDRFDSVIFTAPVIYALAITLM